MTTTTLTALGEGGCSVRLIALIEGYQYALTDAAPAAAVTALAATDYTAALGGLEVDWNLDQRLQPWEPFNSSSSTVTLKIQDVSGTNADTFGLAVFKREGMTVSPLFLDTDVLPGSTTVKVKRSSAFAASGTIHVGAEAIGYTANDNGTNPGTFSTLTRGKWSPFKSEAGARFARTHRAPATTSTNLTPEVEAGTSALVVDAPIDWRGRWVGVWLVRDMGGTLDVLAQSHLAFAGRISSVSDGADGCTYVHCDEIRQVIGDAVILREQWRAKVKPGIMLNTNVSFGSRNERMGISGGVTYADIADCLSLDVVAAGAAGANQINAGVYTGAEIETAINAWLSSELAAGRLFFRQAFRASDTDPNGDLCSSLYFSDDTVTVQLARLWQIGASDPRIGAALGWDGPGLTGSTLGAYSGTEYSDNAPAGAKFNTNSAIAQTVYLADVQGSFADQSSLLNPFTANLSSATGVIRIGDYYMPCRTPSVSAGEGTVVVGPQPMNMFIGADSPESLVVEAETGGDLEITQSLVLEGSATQIILTLLSSTGSGLNWAAYDLLPEHCSAAIPYDLMGSGLEGEIAACPGSGDRMMAIVNEPTKLTALLGVSFTMRLIQFVWRQGRLALRGYATPTTAATLSIGVDVRATPVDTTDDLLTVTSESDALMRNVIKLRHNANADGSKYRDTITITDPGSSSTNGARPVTLDARNATRNMFSEGENIDGLLPIFVGGLAFLVRPAMTLRVALDHTMIEQATPGEVVMFTDGFARDPATGVRGLTNKPALVLSQNASWGGYYGPGEPSPARCEVTLVIFPRLSLAEYSPCAQVDDTSTNAGYVVATKVLTCYAHEHSETSAVADATRFLVGHKVRVIEIDAPVAAAALSWDDTVAGQSANTVTLTTGLAGWDNTKRYRLISDDYVDALTAQRAKAYQADDADGQIADLRAPYGMSFSPTGQVSTYTASVATELPERTPTGAYGDGVALDTGHARAVARGVNNLIGYKTAPQIPNALGSSEVMAFTGAGTWQLVWYEPVFVGVGLTTGNVTRKLYVSPTVLKSGAASADIRVTLARRLPRSVDPSNPSRDDMTRIEPYTETTFTTTSATFETPTPVALGIDHLNMTTNHSGGGIGWLYVEIKNHASFRGMGVKSLGPLVAP